MFGNKKKTKIFILRKIGDSYEKVDEVKFKTEEQLCKYKKHQIPIPPKNPYALMTKKVNVIFFDLDNKEYITFNQVELGLNTEYLEELFGNKIMQQFSHAIKNAIEKPKTNFDFIKNAIIYAIIFGVGYLAGSGGF